MRADKQSFEMGDGKSVKIVVRITNRSNEAVTIFLPGSAPLGRVGCYLRCEQVDSRYAVNAPIDKSQRAGCLSGLIILRPDQTLDLPEINLSEGLTCFEHGLHQIWLVYKFRYGAVKDVQDFFPSDEGSSTPQMQIVEAVSSKLLIYHEVPPPLRESRSQIVKCRMELRRNKMEWWKLKSDLNLTEDRAGSPHQQMLKQLDICTQRDEVLFRHLKRLGEYEECLRYSR